MEHNASRKRWVVAVAVAALAASLPAVTAGAQVPEGAYVGDDGKYLINTVFPIPEPLVEDPDDGGWIGSGSYVIGAGTNTVRIGDPKPINDRQTVGYAGDLTITGDLKFGGTATVSFAPFQPPLGDNDDPNRDAYLFDMDLHRDLVADNLAVGDLYTQYAIDETRESMLAWREAEQALIDEGRLFGTHQAQGPATVWNLGLDSDGLGFGLWPPPAYDPDDSVRAFIEGGHPGGRLNSLNPFLSQPSCDALAMTCTYNIAPANSEGLNRRSWFYLKLGPISARKWTRNGPTNDVIYGRDYVIVVIEPGRVAGEEEQVEASFDVAELGRGAVQFTSTSTAPGGAALTYEWDFGDGETSTERAPKHVYDEPGTYEVRLKATSGTKSDTASEDVVVDSIHVVLVGTELANGLVDLTVHLENWTDEVLTNVRPKGDAPDPLFVNTAQYAEHVRGVAELIQGPDPEWVDTLPPGEAVSLRYRARGTENGFVGWLAQVEAEDPDDVTHEATSFVEVEIDGLPMTEDEFLYLVQSTLGDVQANARRLWDQTMSGSLQSLWDSVGSIRLGGNPTPTPDPTALEATLAQMFGEDPAMFAALPDDSAQAWAMIDAWQRGKTDAYGQALSGRTEPFKNSLEFWWNTATDADLRSYYWREAVAMTAEGTEAVGGALGNAGDFYTDPAKMAAAWDQIPSIASEAGEAIDAKVTQAGNAIAREKDRLAALAVSDPEQFVYELSKLKNRVEAEVALEVVMDLTGTAVAGKVLTGTRWASKVDDALTAGTRAPVDGDAGFSALRRRGDETGDLGDVDGVPGSVAVPPPADPLGPTGRLADRVADLRDDLPNPEDLVNPNSVIGPGGFLGEDLNKIQKVLTDIENDPRYAAYGLDLEYSARMVNPYSSAKLSNGIGSPKPEPLKAKSVTDVDVLLGADPKMLGDVGIFDPVPPPANVLNRLSPELRLEVESRLATRQKEWKEWPDPESGLRQNMDLASQSGGHEFTLDFDRKLSLEIEVETQSNGMIMFRDRTRAYVDGDGVTQYHPFVSDIDGHAFLHRRADGTLGEIPAGIRSQIELNLRRDLQRALPNRFDQHGWTKSGFDWSTVIHKRNADGTLMLVDGKPVINGPASVGSAKGRLKFLFEAMPEPVARASAKRWAEYLTRMTGETVTVDDLLKNIIFNQHVVKITRNNIWTGPGVTP